MDLKFEFKKGLIANFISRYVNILFQIIVTAILARLLTPKEFGVVAVIIVFVNFFNLLSEMGLGPAIIQNKDLSDDEISGLFNFTIIVAFVMAISFASFSYLIADFYKEIEYIKIGKIMTIPIFFFCLEIVPMAVIRKKRDFVLLAKIDVLIGFISGISSIVMAYHGFSYYSIIYKNIISGILTFIISYYFSKIKFRFKCSIILKPLTKVAHYSGYQFAFSFLNYFSRNLDNILIGKYISKSALGLYDMSYKLMLYPIQNFTFVITPVLHPILSEIQTDYELIYQSYIKLIKILAIVGISISVFSFFTSEEIIIIMYGRGWIECIPVFKILSLMIGIQMILSSSGSIFQAVGRTDYLFICGLFSSTTNVIAIISGVLLNKIEYVAFFLLISFSINFFQCYYLMQKRVFKKRYIEFFYELKNPAIIGFIIAIGLFPIFSLGINSIFLTFILKIAVSIVCFLIGLYLTKELKNLKEIFLK